MEKKESFNPFMPGFDLMQNWLKGASQAIPGMGQWVTPSLDPEELKKRIQELKTIQFWLEQNSRMVATTIQALEVQCMTLSTLQTMNIKMADLQASLKAKPETPEDGLPESSDQSDESKTTEPSPDPKKPAAPVVDPMKWWHSLTEQFAHIATSALKEPEPAAPAADQAPAESVKPKLTPKRSTAAPAPQKTVSTTKPVAARKAASPPPRKPKS